MDVVVGLVSGTTFRVPSPAVRETFGLGTLSVPLAAARAAVSRAGEFGLERRTPCLASATVPPIMAERAQAILDEEDALTSLHRLYYAPAAPRVADTCGVSGSSADRGVVRWFDAARRRLPAQPQHGSVALVEEPAPDPAVVEQERLDAWWQALCDNDPETVMAQLVDAFDEADLPATPVSVQGGYVEIAVLAPGEHVLPTQVVTRVGTGGLSIRRAPAERRERLNRQVVAGVVLAAVNRVLTAAPGVLAVRVVVLRAAHRGYHADLSPVAVAEVSRPALGGAELALDPETVLLRIGDALKWEAHGLVGALCPLPLDDVAGIAPLLARLCRSAEVDAPRTMAPAFA